MEAKGKKVDHHLELLRVASKSGESETVKRVLGKYFTEEVDRIISHLINIDPDYGIYCRYVGELRSVYRLKKELELNIFEGREALEELKRS